jgi:hypothetical protein
MVHLCFFGGTHFIMRFVLPHRRIPVLSGGGQRSNNSPID